MPTPITSGHTQTTPPKSPKRALKVAIVHDWLIGGGAERVVYELHTMFPDAPIFTSYATAAWRQKLDGKVVTGFLQHWPFSVLRKYIGVLRMWWFSHLNLSAYDLVISSTGNGEAFGIRVSEDTVHICYCHSPTHYYWRHYDTYLAKPGFGPFDPLARLGLKALVGPLRKWDYRAAQRPTAFLANSTHIKHDISSYYGRDSEVIFPPIDTGRFTRLSAKKRSGFVTVGRQVPHKHTSIIVEACTQHHLPLTVIGSGPEHSKLVAMAGPTVTFVTDAADNDVAEYLAAAEGFIFASFDDFGITPVEAMAAGTPVIAYRAGGALDYVTEGKTGLFFDQQTTASLSEALKKFTDLPFDHAAIQRSASRFSPEVFRTAISAAIQKQVSDK